MSSLQEVFKEIQSEEAILRTAKEILLAIISSSSAGVGWTPKEMVAIAVDMAKELHNQCNQ